MPQLAQAAIDAAEVAAAKLDADVYLYNGGVMRSRVLECVETIHDHASRDHAIVIIVTNGGEPDAAYKISRYIQDKYQRFSAIIPGYCKSAGTLFAIGAQELVFTPFGELGPLDIQLTKIDRFDQMQSGLTIQEALDTLENRALQSFYKVVQDYIQANNGLISFSTVSKAAADFIAQLYAPVFSRIDPEEIGGRSRSMRIATEYGKRLSIKGQNIKPQALHILTETYPSHSFAIDQREAEELFIRVREANELERAVVFALGRHARFEVPKASEFVFRALSKRVEKGATKDADDHGRASSPGNGRHPARADGAPAAEAKSTRGGGKRKPVSAAPRRRRRAASV